MNNSARKSGFALLLSIIILTAIIIFASSQFSTTTSFIHFGSNKILKEQANALAEAGVDYAIWQINQNAGNWYGGGSEVAVGTTGTFFVTVTDNGPNLKTVQSTGYIPDSVNPRGKASVKTQLTVNTQTVEFNFAVQTGEGGVSMSNSATINGNIYSNGPITAGAGNQQLINGDAISTGTIDSPPITVTGSISQNQPPETIPTIDYQFWKDQATLGGTTVCTPDCEINGTVQTIGPRKYQGNLTISNQAVVTIAGPIYVTGNISVANGGTRVNLSQSFGSTGTVIISDGTISVTQGGAFNPTVANPPGYILVVTTSTAATAMNISNSGANAVFYALDGETSMSQSANVNALVTKQLTMQNTATLTYATGLASAQFNSGPGGSWVVRKGTYRQTK